MKIWLHRGALIVSLLVLGQMDLVLAGDPGESHKPSGADRSSLSLSKHWLSLSDRLFSEFDNQLEPDGQNEDCECLNEIRRAMELFAERLRETGQQKHAAALGVLNWFLHLMETITDARIANDRTIVNILEEAAESVVNSRQQWSVKYSEAKILTKLKLKADELEDLLRASDNCLREF